MTLNEANNHYSKHGLKEIFKQNDKKIQMLNNYIIDQFEDLKKQFGEDHFITTHTKKDVDFLLTNNTSEITPVK